MPSIMHHRLGHTARVDTIKVMLPTQHDLMLPSNKHTLGCRHPTFLNRDFVKQFLNLEAPLAQTRCPP